MSFIWNNIVLGIFANIFLAPVAYFFRTRCQEKKGFLWEFLSDNNMYGDVNWRPNLTNKFFRAYLWMLRNPRQNYYWRNYVDGKDCCFFGTCKVKINQNALSWRTCIFSDTGDNHGNIIDWDKSPFGVQDIEFERVDYNGNSQKCYRKSTCIPRRFFKWIYFHKRRRGHEHGLMQYAFSFHVVPYKQNKDGYLRFKNTDWKLITI